MRDAAHASPARTAETWRRAKTGSARRAWTGALAAARRRNTRGAARPRPMAAASVFPAVTGMEMAIAQAIPWARRVVTVTTRGRTSAPPTWRSAATGWMMIAVGRRTTDARSVHLTAN